MEKPTLCISSSIMGGLGNQLFQVFATIAYGIKHNRKIIFPENITVQSKYPRHTYWDSFLKHLFIFTTKFPANKITQDMLFAYPIYQEGQGFSYVAIPEFKNTNVRLHGYFQSYKYFDKYEANILNLIKLNNIRDGVLTKYGDQYLRDKTVPTVSMHFRLGDYKILPDYHPVLSYVYYVHALQYLLGKIGEKFRVLIFCDKEDMDTVKGYVDNHFLTRISAELEYIYVESDMEDWEEMVLMSACDHHIIANSTFSWWGAYLAGSQNKEKIVCYPDVWFGMEYMNQNTKDLFPERWTRIDAGMPHLRYWT